MSDVDAFVHRIAERALTAPDELVAIIGPTASGKTELAIRIAETIGGEVVGCDSVQIYRRFDIGSGKPTAEERARAPHHLVDELDPHDAIDAASYAVRARAAIEAIRSRGRIPILSGGTFLWTKAALFGLAKGPAADETIRARHRAQVVAEGKMKLHEELAKVDPGAAARLHPNDTLRVSRALEVFELTGKRLSDEQASHGFREPAIRSRLYAIRIAPEVLTARIESRAKAWLAGGWLDEVRALVRDGYGASRALGSVGYREVRTFLDGELPEAELLPSIVRATKIFARRQRTWLNHEPVDWLVR